MQKRKVVGLVLLLLLTFTLSQAQDGDESPLKTLTHDGVERRYMVYIPESYTGDEPVAAVFLLHGRGGDGTTMALLTDMNRFADEHGFIAVYPDGQERIIEDDPETGVEGGTDRYWGFTTGIEVYVQPEHDDVDFLKTVVDDLAGQVNLDRERVYVAGFSNGGYMVHRLACEAGDTFAAFASVGAAGFAALDRICDETQPVPMLIMHGTNDLEVPWEGIEQTFDVADGSTQDVFTSLPILATVDYWVRHNICVREPEYVEYPRADEDAPTMAVSFTFMCAEGAPVVFYTIIGGGHNWPGVPDVMPSTIGGSVNTDIHASQAIWEFFADKSLGAP